MRLALRRGLPAFACVALTSGLVASFPGCGRGPYSVGIEGADGASPESSSAAGTACRAIGGACVLGAAPCAQQASSSAQDCNPPPENPGGAFCCLQPQEFDAASADGEAGVRCEAGAGGPVSPDAAACFIDLNQYDRSCSIDSDCVWTVELSCAVNQNSVSLTSLYIRGGNFCDGCNCNMPAGINRSAVAQYVADVSRTPEGSGQVAFPICNCPPPPPTRGCCQAGQCVGVCSSGCSASSPCAAGTSGCPGNGSPLPAAGDACSAVGITCYGYGSLSCPATLTCSAAGTWQVTCPAHPFGTDSGTCACSL